MKTNRYHFLILMLVAAVAWTMPNRSRAAEAGAGIGTVADPVEMALERLGGSHGLQLEEPAKGEKGAAADRAKGPAEGNRWKDEEEDEEEGEDDKQKDGSKKIGKGKEPESTEANEGNEEKTEAELEIEAFEQKISDLEGKLESATEDEKATVQAELEAAEEGLKLWQAELEAPAGGSRPTDFSAEQESFVKAVESKAAAIVQEKEQLESKVQELEQALAQAGEQPIGVANVHPLLFADQPEQVAEVEASWRGFEKWALANWDGVEESTNEKTGKVTPGFTKEQVRERYAAIKEARESLIPVAKESLQARQQAEARARKEYPELFKAGSADARVLQNLLTRFPAIKVVFPDVWTVVRDALEGQRAREARAAKKGKNLPSARGQAGAAGRKHLPRAAKAGGSGAGAAAAAGARRSAKAKSEPVIDMSKFMNGGGDKAALIAAMS